MADFTPRVLRSQTGTLTAYDHGAHVAQWQQHGQPVLWLSDRSHYEHGESIRGGVPVCWPWFASGPDGDLSPTHGFVRLTGWQLLESTLSSLRWGIGSADVAGRPGVERFPHPFAAVLETTLTDDSLGIALTVTNTGDSPVDYEAALHSYLHVGDVQAVTIDGLEGVGYWDKVIGTPGTQDGQLTITGETDRIYETADPVTLSDPVLGRVLLVEPVAATRTVVWNPWRAGAAELADMADDAWRRMVCIEAAAIGAECIHLGAGQTHTIGQRISVREVGLASPR